MAKSLSNPVQAKVVRAWYAENKPADVPAPGSRGLLNPAVIAAFTEATGQRYVAGTQAVVEIPFTKVSKSGQTLKRTVKVSKSEARTLAGDLAGKRGRLSAAALTAAGVAYVKSQEVTPTA